MDLPLLRLWNMCAQSGRRFPFHALACAILSTLLCYAAPRAVAQTTDFMPQSAGLRFGFANGSSSGSALHQGEAFVDWDLPWKLEWDNDWKLQARLDASAGWLGDSTHSGAVVSVGPLLALKLGRLPLEFEGGVSPTGLTRYRYDAKNFGEPFQFTSHAGIEWEFIPHVKLGYRFQHMSNAGISRHNPGLNLHMICLSYRF